jgi:hypothetical protein
MSNKKSIFCNHRRAAYARLMYYVINVLGYERNGLKIKTATRIFCDKFKLTYTNPIDRWLVDLYLSGTNEIISKCSKVIPVKPKKKDKNEAKGLTYRKFLLSDYWKEVRKEVLKRDNNECVVCHTNKRLCIHHITYKHHGFEHKHLSDLVTLCDSCHKSTHGLCSSDMEEALRRN